jgi:hypothetical protein
MVGTLFADYNIFLISCTFNYNDNYKYQHEFIEIKQRPFPG